MTPTLTSCWASWLVGVSSNLFVLAASLVLGVMGCGGEVRSDSGHGPQNAAGAAGTGAGGTGGDLACDDVESGCLLPSGEPKGPLTKPVGRPATGDSPGTIARTVAFRAIHLGDPDIDLDTPSYKDLGFDLDGVHSTAGFGHHCKASVTGKNDVDTDGSGGIDNMFAKRVVPAMAAEVGDYLAEMTYQINHGGHSMAFVIDGLGDGANYTSLSARMYAVHGPTDSAGNTAPLDDFSTYAWDPLDTQPDGVLFADSYVNQHVWVSGAPVTFPISFWFSWHALTLDVFQGVVQMQFDDSYASASNGVLAGVVRTEQVSAQVYQFLMSLDPCDLPVYDELAESLKAYSDIYLDENGHLVDDPTHDCNAMSFAIGFEAVQSAMSSVTDDSTQHNACE